MELIKKAEFAKKVGISRPAVTNLCHKSLVDAVVDGKIDLDADCVKKYLLGRGSSVETDSNIRGRDEGDTGGNLRSDAEISDFETMTLSELCEIFGTDERFKVWLAGRRLITDIKIKELKLSQEKGVLVSRELIRVGVIEQFNSCHIKLLTDGAKTIARRATAMHSAERPLEDIEKFVAEQITSFIRPVKAKVARALKNA